MAHRGWHYSTLAGCGDGKTVQRPQATCGQLASASAGFCSLSGSVVLGLPCAAASSVTSSACHFSSVRPWLPSQNSRRPQPQRPISSGLLCTRISGSCRKPPIIHQLNGLKPAGKGSLSLLMRECRASGKCPTDPGRYLLSLHCKIYLLGKPIPVLVFDPSDAGWSSLAARRAHNPKVAGSNPAPATERSIKAKHLCVWLLCICVSGFCCDTFVAGSVTILCRCISVTACHGGNNDLRSM